MSGTGIEIPCYPRDYYGGPPLSGMETRIWEAYGSQFTGKAHLVINQGGLQLRGVSRDSRESFKHFVSPKLAQFVGIDGKLTARVVADVAEGKIKKAVLYLK